MAKKKRNKKAFWRDIKFKYKLSITNENTLEEVTSIHVSKLNGISVLLSILFVLFLIASIIIAYTPLRYYLPGYMNSEIRTQIVENALRVDSLERLVAHQNMYIMNIQDIFRGEVKTDTIHSMDSLTILRADSLMERTQREADFRRRYEETEKYNLTNIVARSEADGMMFQRPARGIIASPFNSEKQHHGVEIATNPGESILATLDGIVILSAYTAEAGHVVQIMHDRQFVSVYKHCSSRLKQEGEQVKAGEVIALIGKSPEEGNAPLLHFELWHNGRPVNPEHYIVF